MEYVERTLSYLTSSLRGRDPKLFTRPLGNIPAFTSPPSPTLTVTSPTCGASGSRMDIEYTQDGLDTFPTLSWFPPPSTDVAEYFIPGGRTSICQADIEKEGTGNEVKGGFRYEKNRRGTVYSGPRPLRGHGEHRYFYQVIALREGLDVGKMSAAATIEELAKEASVEGRILAWGEWIGVAERK